MSAGTITLTNNSDVVTGRGTQFSTDITAGDFIVATVGGITYTLPVKALDKLTPVSHPVNTVDSDTLLTLVSHYTGPTQSGVAWYAVPRMAMNLVIAAMVAQSTEALRGLNYDRQNWQQVFSATADTVSVMLPDGTQFSGPPWGKLAQQVQLLAPLGKRLILSGTGSNLYPDDTQREYHLYVNNNGTWGGWDDTAGAAVPLPVGSGGTGSETVAGAIASFGLKPVGTSGDKLPLLSGKNTWSGLQSFNGNILSGSGLVIQSGTYSQKGPTGASSTGIFSGKDSATFDTPSNLNLYSWNGIGFCTSFTNPSNGVVAGTPAVYINTRNGTINAKGAVQANGVNLTSDWNAKEAVTVIDPAEALQKMSALDGYTFRYKDAGSDRLTAGVLAQELNMIIPDLVILDGASNYLVANYMGLTGYIIAAVKGLKLKVDDLADEVVRLKGSGS